MLCSVYIHTFPSFRAWRCDIQGASSGKLAGKTVAIKDNVAVAGVPMSNGSQLLDGYVPEYDASVITRILDAGTVKKQQTNKLGYA